MASCEESPCGEALKDCDNCEIDAQVCVHTGRRRAFAPECPTGSVAGEAKDDGEGCCQADFWKGREGTDMCPAGTEKIRSTADCIAAQLQIIPRGEFRVTLSDEALPSGCIAIDRDWTYFNAISTGEAHSQGSPICSVTEYVKKQRMKKSNLCRYETWNGPKC